MFQPGKQSGPHAQQRSVRLPKQSSLPSYGNIQLLMQEAQKMKGRIVELPFATGDRKSEYVLSVQCYTKEQDPSGTIDPEWTLTDYNAGAPRVEWKHPSRDVTLICNLVAN